MINPTKLSQVFLNQLLGRFNCLFFLFLIAAPLSLSVAKAETEVLFGGENQFEINSMRKKFSFYHEADYTVLGLNSSQLRISKVNSSKIPFGDRFTGGFYARRETIGSNGKIEFLKKFQIKTSVGIVNSYGVEIFPLSF